MHFENVFDLGLDYGADGGQSWNTQVINFPNGTSRRNEVRTDAIGRWQLGNRLIDSISLKYMLDFMHAMRGRAHSFLYKDWNDYSVVDEPIVIDGTGSSQLTKTYGLSINAWIRTIAKPRAATVVITYDTGGGPAILTAGVDYTLDATTGIVTWLLGPAPNAPETMTWTGEFYVPVRFDRDELSAQFLSLEERPAGDELAYSIGALSVVEELGV